MSEKDALEIIPVPERRHSIEPIESIPTIHQK
jgi:hypothetical protein